MKVTFKCLHSIISNTWVRKNTEVKELMLSIGDLPVTNAVIVATCSGANKMKNGYIKFALQLFVNILS